MNDKIKIFEVGPRDGLQNEHRILGIDSKLHFINMLIEAGCKDIEAGAFVREDLLPQMADTDKLLPLAIFSSPEDIKFHCLVPNTHGLKKAQDAGVNHIGLLTSICNTFSKRNLNATFQESVERLERIIKECHPGNFKRLYLSMAFHSSWSGKIDNDVFKEKADALSKLDIDEFVLSDTNGLATPEDVIEKVNILKEMLPVEKIACHFHDTHNMALENIEQAWKEGITIFDSSCGGLGGCPFTPGATGNVSTESVVRFFNEKSCSTGIDPILIDAAASYIKSALEMAAVIK